MPPPRPSGSSPSSRSGSCRTAGPARWSSSGMDPLASFTLAELDAAFITAQTPPADSATVRLEAYDIGWRTADQPGPQVDLTVPPGATIELVNVGAAPHNFGID